MNRALILLGKEDTDKKRLTESYQLLIDCRHFLRIYDFLKDRESFFEESAIYFSEQIAENLAKRRSGLEINLINGMKIDFGLGKYKTISRLDDIYAQDFMRILRINLRDNNSIL